MEYQLSHEESLSKFKWEKWPALFFLLDRIDYPDNIAHLIRITNSLWWTKIIIWGSREINMKKIESVAKSYNTRMIDIIKTDNILDYILNNKNIEQFVCVEITSNSRLYYNVKYDFSKSIWIIVWSEKHWISNDILSSINRSVHIPMLWSNSSMNVSHAWIVVAYDIVRQYLSNI